MEAGSSDGEKKPPESGGGEPKVKRKMKTAAQLEVLENTYKVETYPSEALRADLSVQLGLNDRQLQMWFCHRRLKDRKAPSASASTSAKRPRKEEVSPVTVGTPAATSAGGAVVTSFLPPPPSVVGKDEMLGLELGNNEHGSRSGSGSGSSPYRYMEPQRRGGYRPRTGVALPRISGHMRYYEPPLQPVAELRAIAFVEAQLGEPLRDDGPALGMEFDPLPPGAFGAPIGAPEKTAGRSYEASIYEHSDAKSFKQGPGRALHEYQFLPEQPTVRSDSYERSQSHYYGSPTDGPAAKTPPLAGGRSYMHNFEEVPVAYGISNHMPSMSLISQPGKTGGHGPSSAGEYGSIGRKSPFMAVGLESPYNAHPNTGLEDALIPSERRITQEDEVVRVERKRKSDDVRLAREMEANEKKMRKELERQDILRRKREELMRKEMERIDRERRKEEERLLREKQREEERYQREQRREMERREKILLKESIRAEKMRQKEELRREREAVRQKAANDRAVARRLAKESMELIEDERLELMEIAASRKSFPSIVSLDSETLQNLDSYRDLLLVFPPKSVQLKKPFATQPWLDSEENVGNLLMAWRFLITFADVLGLWPFTLDEFLQAFHDYDPRLLGEINVALLRTIIKDIEDGSRTSSGLGVNQNNMANPGGGHPHIVEGAYAWGFDICSWQHNLNLLTWQEILRQFALSAGFGPKLKKRKVDQAYPRDDNEGDDGVNVISNLRTGAAVESAVAIMREKGYSNPRRSRHRLTPGTVKFAAFHVLSFEGSKGLNILDVADKIQNSGLRDLTTSKTPEASIAAALSRDTKIFERTAPSTYCVRSPYRKDPVDAEAILADAREKIRIFKSGFMEGVEEADVDGVEPDEVEKDDDSESDIADDPEVDDLGTVLAPNSDSKVSYDLNLCGPKDCLNDGVGNFCASVDITPDRLGNMAEGLSTVNLPEETTNADNDDTGIDESSPGEPWVQGLTEGEYSNLSIEERLNALVSLIGVATEGNSIRVVLEERLEAATALKKQMWAESQLDKRRLIHDPTNDGNDMEQCVYAAERSRALMKSFIGHKAEELYVHRSLPLGQDRRRNRYWQFVASVSCNDPGAGRVFVELHNGGGWRLIDCEEDFDALLASLDVRGVRESHLHALLRRVEPLFRESVRKNKLDTSANELSCSFFKTEGSEIPLNPESCGGTDSRSRILCASNSEIPEPSTSFHIESGKSSLEIKNALSRYNNFEDWIWRKCMSSSVLRATKYGKKRCTQLVDMCDSCHDVYYFEDNHCHTCHKTFTAFDKSFNFSDHVAQCEETKAKASIGRKLHHFDYPPARIRLLKVLLALVEVCILPEALQPAWSDTYRKLWGMKLHMSSSAEDLLQVVTLLEGATKRDFLSSNFQTTSELLASGNVVGRVVNDAFNFGTVTVLPWIPITTSAVALRLMDLDSAISYLPDQRETEKDREARHFIKLPSNYTGNMNSQEVEFDGPHGQHQQEDFSLDVETEHLGFSTRGGRGGRGRGQNQGGKSQRRAPLSQSEPRLGQVIGGWKGRSSRGKGVRKRGRRSVRSTQRPVKKMTPTVQTEPVEPLIFNTSPPGFSGRNMWNGPEESTGMQVDDNDDSNFEKSEYEEDDVRMSGDEYDDYAAIYNGKAPIDRGDFNMDDDDEDDDQVVGDELDVNGGEFEQGDEDVRGYFNADSDEDDNENGNEGEAGDRPGDGDEDETSDSGSSDYSSD